MPRDVGRRRSHARAHAPRSSAHRPGCTDGSDGSRVPASDARHPGRPLLSRRPLVFRRACWAALLVAATALAVPLAQATPALASTVTNRYVPMAPVRLMDTRPGGATVDGRNAGAGKLGTASTIDVDVVGRAGIPAEATSVALNVTAIDASWGYVQVFPTGDRRHRRLVEPQHRAARPDRGQPGRRADRQRWQGHDLHPGSRPTSPSTPSATSSRRRHRPEAASRRCPSIARAASWTPARAWRAGRARSTTPATAPTAGTSRRGPRPTPGTGSTSRPASAMPASSTATATASPARASAERRRCRRSRRRWISSDSIGASSAACGSASRRGRSCSTSR